MAHRAAQGRRGAARRGHSAIDEHPPLRDEVHARLHRGWSPEEIAGSLKLDHPSLPSMHTSHESIYRYVYVVARGALQRELAACLRRHSAGQQNTRKPHRRGVAATQGILLASRMQDMVLVDQRPPEVEARLLPGHFEGDLILGAGNRSAVGVLVERASRYTFLCHLPQKDATSVREAFTRKLKALPAALRKSLTYDQGKEMAEHSAGQQNARRRPQPAGFLLSPAQPLGAWHLRKPETRQVGATSPRAPTWRPCPTNNSAPIRRRSMSAPEKSSAGSFLLKVSTNSLRPNLSSN